MPAADKHLLKAFPLTGSGQLPDQRRLVNGLPHGIADTNGCRLLKSVSPRQSPLMGDWELEIRKAVRKSV
ncbi:MAG: hypothetical protein HYZ21_14750 [Chloroflexi bacterium]|nr:hypothetical protein [Chloroflexota bacterium]